MKNWFKVFFFLSVCGLLVYFNSLNNKFLIDDFYFLKTPVLSSVKFSLFQWNPYGDQALGIVDSHGASNYYRPMQNMVLGFCYGAFKSHYWQYHLFNLFLFVVASSLIYLLVEKLTADYVLALLTSFFYLVHPINGIIVNYISASVFSFQVIFALAAILLLWESLENKNNRVLYLVSLLFSFFSLFWHESGVMIAFYLSVVILLFRKDSLKHKAVYLFPYFLIVFSYLVFRFLCLGAFNPFLKSVVLFHITIGGYLAGLFQILVWYISKLFYPRGIVMEWVSPILHGSVIWYVIGANLLFLLLILFFLKFAKEKILRMAVIWILIGFAPVCLSAFIRSNTSVQIEPHWLVISSIGFFILAAYFCVIILNRAKIIGLAVLFILIFMWGAISHANNRLWVDQKTYALYWLQQIPHFKYAYQLLGEAYQREGALKESRKYYKLAVSGNISDVIICGNLGLLDQREGDLKGAELNYKMILTYYPFWAQNYTNLGALYSEEGQFDKAKNNFQRALMLNPLLLEPRRGLAKIALKYAEYREAINLCLKNLDIVNDDHETLLLLVNIFIQKGDYSSAKKYSYHLINAETDPDVLTRLGIMMMENNNFVIALDCFEKAIRIAPDDTRAYLAAGTLFANAGKYDQAIHIWQLASGINPSDHRLKDYIAKAMALKH